MDILQEIKEIIVKTLGVAESQITENADFQKDLGADSLDSVELIMAFEEKFGIEIPDKEANKIMTIGSVIKYIEERIKEKGE